MIQGIHKEVILKTDLDRVWRAISDSKEFGLWFGMKFEGPFKQGEKVKGSIKPTTVDPEVAEMQRPYEGKSGDIVVDRMEPKKLFSFKWHPYAADENTDYSKEPMTTVSFVLKPVSGGVHLTITETGFENLPESRREEARNANDGGWQKQTELISKYLTMNR